MDSSSYHLPDLHNVVFRNRADDPGLVGVPGEVGDLGGVASMDELVDKRLNDRHVNNLEVKWFT